MLLLSGSIEDIVSTSFYLSYHMKMQPSEVDRLSTYEFNTYVELLNKQLQDEREYELKLVQNYGVGGLFGQVNER